jgi:hypothetical protein
MRLFLVIAALMVAVMGLIISKSDPPLSVGCLIMAGLGCLMAVL